MSANAQTLARPYARAAFELAQAGGQLPQWSQQLALTAQLVLAPAISQALTGPGLRPAEQVEVLLPAGTGSDDAFGHFLAVLASNKRLPLLPAIAAQYEYLRAQAERRVNARVRTAVALDAEQLESLRAALARRFQREIEISNEVDASLLGGAVIDTGDIVIDGSVRGRLDKLHSQLTH
ncbi:MAG: F0F1 ATP synthase subunit delta [Xanthomonadales bacterium]|nr:F0F1 ATP synthase subunit delta [Xanthomonadales bacterium]